MGLGGMMAKFAGASLGPWAVLAAAAVWGGPWVWLALGCLTVGLIVLDLLLPLALQSAPEGAEFPASDALLVALALAALALLCGVAARAPELGPLHGTGLVLAAGLWLGQVAHPAAHELIHRPGRGLFRLGVGVYTALLWGAHVSSHRLVHHVHVATPQDPASAPAGMGFWRFLLRAGPGGWRAGWRAERARRRVPPHVGYAAGAVGALALAGVLGGPWGVLVWALLGLHVQFQIHLSDYVQHYGLRRARLPDGRYAPVGPAHSWNAGHAASGAMMLHAPRHSDHHARPAHPYAALHLPDPGSAPHLPWPLPVACLIALVPPLWRRAMAPHLRAWETERR